MGALGDVASAARWTALAAWGERGLSTVVFFLLARLLTPEDYGLVTVTGTLVFFLNVVQDGGLPQAVVQYEDLRPAHIRTALTSNVVVGVVSTAALVLGADPIAAFLGSPDSAPLIRALAVNLLLAGVAAVPAAMLQRTLRFKSLALRGLLAKVVGGSLAIWLAFAGAGPWALIGQSITQAAVSVVVLWLAIPERPSLGFERRAFRELFSYGAYTLGIRLLNAGTDRGDDVVISRLAGPTSLGFYTIAYRVLDILEELFGKVISKVLMPVLSRLQDDREAHRQAVLDVAAATTALASPAFIGWVLVADLALPLLAGEKWLPSVPASQALAFVGLRGVMLSSAGAAMTSLGHARPMFLLKVVGTIAAIATYVATARIGITELATAYAVVVWATAPLALWLMRRYAGVPIGDYLRQQRAPLIAAAAMAAAILGLRTTTIDDGSRLLAVLVLVPVGVAVYLGVLGLADRPLLRKVVRTVRR